MRTLLAVVGGLSILGSAIAVEQGSTKDDSAERAKARAELAEQIRLVQSAKDARIKDAATKAALEKKMADAAIEATVRVILVGHGGILAAPVGEARKGPPKTAVVSVPIGTPSANQRVGHGDGSVVMVKEKLDARDPVPLNDLIFVACQTEGLFDGATARLKFWPSGIYRYLSERKIEHSVPAYSTVYLGETPAGQ